MNRTIPTLITFAALAVAVACGGTPHTPPPASTSAAGAAGAPPAPGAPAAPVFRLPTTVRPTRYALDLTLLPEEPTFKGVVDIELELAEPTRVIWLHGGKLTIQDASLTAAGKTQPATVLPSGEHLLGFQLATPVGPGPAHLRVAYAGEVSLQDFEGFFREQDGDAWYLFTQGEAIGARHMFPCFDEPGFKVPFAITVHARQEHGAFSNAPMVGEQDEPGGMKVVKFAETRPMPSYLVAIAVGPFDVVPIADKPTVMRAIVPRGHLDELDWVKEITPTLLERLEAYFGTPYPYEKLDIVAVPFFLGAMENPGLITVTSRYMLVEPGQMTVTQRRGYASVMTHELAHQWFGDLVTMAWWDDIWLNESFASWIEQKIVAAWKPEWQTDVDHVKDRSGALSLDALVTAHRIREPVENQSALETSGGGLVYSKGSSMLRMFEAWIGADVFQRGVQLYLRRHAWGNATAGDFLAALGEAAGKDVATPFATFLDQSGEPLVSVTLACEQGQPPTLTLAQRRFVPLGAQGAELRTWQAPVCVRFGSGTGAGASSGRACTLLTGPSATLALDTRTCPEWVLPNADARGYYRSRLEPALLEKLVAISAKQLSPAERVGLVGDLAALVEAGMLPADDALNLTAGFARDTDALVVHATLGLVGDVERRLLADDDRPRYARFLQKRYGARARALGWAARPGDSDAVRLLRPALVQLLATDGQDARLAARGKALALAWLADRKAVDPDVAGAALAVAVYHGDAALFDRVLAEARRTGNADERRRLLAALGRFSDAALARRALALVLSDDFLTIDSRSILGSLFANRRTRELAYAWVKQQFDALAARLPRGAAAGIVRYAGGFCDQDHEADAHAFFGERAAALTAGTIAVGETLERIRLCRAYRGAQAESVARFLAAY